MAAHYERNRRLLAPLGLAALTALAVAGCTAHSTTPTAAPTTTITVTPAAQPTENAPEPQAATTVTVTPPPPQLPTIKPFSGNFQSPSGNIVCTMYTGVPDGQNEARCAVTQHDWQAPRRSDDCHLAWGDRLDLPQGSPARFGCYGQEMPPVQETLGYGQGRSLGTLVCISDETTGITCTDTSTGHFFRVSRQTYNLG